MKNIARSEKIWIVSFIVILLVIIPLVCYIFFIPKFKIIEFQETKEILWKMPFEQDSGDICYGNIFSCKSVNVEVTGEVDTDNIGEYPITYIYSYQNKTMKKIQYLYVKDKESPEIKVTKEKIAYCENGNVELSGIHAIDNYDGDITNKIEAYAENGKVTITVSDSSGNIVSQTYEGVLTDEAPKIVLNGPENLYIDLKETYQEKGATAMDICDGDLTANIEIISNVDTSKPGQYHVVYRIRDKKGNEASITRNVMIENPKEVVKEKNKKIYLTFDDGPSNYTEQLLNTLKKYDAKVTFFVTNQKTSIGYDSLIKRAYEEGHTIGLHSNSHDYSIYENEETFFKDLYAIQKKVKNITGHTSWIMRFPGGSSNTISKGYDNGTHIMSKLTKSVEEKGFRYYDWNILSGDAGETQNTTEIVSNVIREFGKFQTPIVLQHDIKGYSVDAVDAILEYGLSHGYEFEAISMDTPVVHHHINN